MKLSPLFKTTAALLVLAAAGFTITACQGHPEAGVANVDDADPLFQQKSIAGFNLVGTKKIVLTYDDGPTPAVTKPLLDLLRKHQIKATFFMLGKSVKGQEAVLKQMRADGHVLANHSYSHENLSLKLYEMDKSALLKQTLESHRQLAPFMNPQHRMYFRAPYGAWTSSHAAKLNAIPEIRDYIGPVFWNVGGEILPRGTRPQTKEAIEGSADWDCWTTNTKKNIKPIPVDVCMTGYLKDIRRKQGGVVLMHDKDIRTVQMTEKLLPILIKEGYEFITLEDVRALDQYE